MSDGTTSADLTNDPGTPSVTPVDTPPPGTTATDTPGVYMDPTTGKFVDASGNEVSTDGTTAPPVTGTTTTPGVDSSGKSIDPNLEAWIKSQGVTDPSLLSKVAAKFTNADGSINWSNVLKTGAMVAGGAAALTGSGSGTNTSQGGGYQGGIPSLTASRTMLPIAAHRPGQGGTTYFSPMTYLGTQNMAPGPAGGTSASPGVPGGSTTGIATLPGATSSTGTTGTTAATAATSGTSSTNAAGLPSPSANSPAGGYQAGTGGSITLPNGKTFTAQQIQDFRASGGDINQFLQSQGITDLGQIHQLVTQADQVAGYNTGTAALQQYFAQYQKNNPNGADANNFQSWVKNQNTGVLNAMMSGTYSGAATSSADFAPGGLYGPGSAYYGQSGYGSGLGLRGMGSQGGNTAGAATGATPLASTAQQQQIMANASQGTSPPSSAQMLQYYNDHKNDANAQQEFQQQIQAYGLTPAQLQAAGIPSSVAAAPATTTPAVAAPAPAVATQPGISTADIQGYYQQHQNDANAQQEFQQAIQQYGITPAQLQAAGLPAGTGTPVQSAAGGGQIVQRFSGGGHAAPYNAPVKMGAAWNMDGGWTAQ